MHKKINKHNILLIVIFMIVLTIFCGYALIVIYFTWPISEYSISKAGGFGDSFGFITALFSGLAFAGVLYTIILQREELFLTREQLTKSASALDEQVKLLTSQRKREDFYRLIESLNRYIAVSFKETKCQSGQTLEWAVSALNKASQKANIEKLFSDFKDKNTVTYKLIKKLDSDLKIFMNCLIAYNSVSGDKYNSTPFIKYYKNEYGELVKMLHEYAEINRTVYDFYYEIPESEIMSGLQ